jgi:antitoxin (DNA-binding transcriptional repressor) of toxin-antitoxin stability system
MTMIAPGTRERREVIVTKGGKRVARIVPIDESSSDEALARLRGSLVKGTKLSDFDTGAKWQVARR